MKLGIYTIEKTLYEGEIKELIAKSSTGEISILANHIPLITKLIAAPLRIIEADGTEKSVDVGTGFLEIKPENNIVVLVDSF